MRWGPVGGPSCWRGDWSRRARSSLRRRADPRERRRDGRGAGARPAGATRPAARRPLGLGVHCGRRCLSRCGSDQGDRRAARRALRGADHQRRPGRGAQRGGGPGAHRARRVRRIPTACQPTGGSSRCWASSTTPWWRRWRRASPAPVAPPATRRHVRRSTGATGQGPCGPGAASPSCPAPPCWCAPTSHWDPTSSTPALRGGEDVDLVWRLGEAGWDVRYVPSSTVAHEGPTTLRAFLARRAFYGTTAAPLARRHGEALAPVHLSGWTLAVWSLVLARRPVLALATLAASVTILARRLRGLVRDPVGVAAHIAGGGTAALAAPALSVIDTRLVAGARARIGLPADPRRIGAGAADPRVARLGLRPAGTRTRCRRGRARGRRRRLRHGGLGRLRAGADAGAARSPRVVALARLVRFHAAQRATAGSGGEGVGRRRG